MPGFTDYLEEKLIKHAFGKGGANSYTPPTVLGVALHTADPGELPGTGNEVSTSGTGYARIDASFTFVKAANGRWQGSNTAAVQFAAATTAWGTITYFSVNDALTAGNRLCSAQLTTPESGYVTPAPKDVAAGDVVRFDIGALLIELD